MRSKPTRPGKGQLGNSRIYILYDEVVGKVLEEALRKMAVTAFEATGGTSEDTAKRFETAALKFVDDTTDWLQRRYKSDAAFGTTGPPDIQLAPIRSRLLQHE